MRSDVELIIEEMKKLGDPSYWKLPDGYHQSVALSILDSIWSMGVNYDKHVVLVIDRYRNFRCNEGADPEKDSAADLVSVFDRVGGSGLVPKVDQIAPCSVSFSLEPGVSETEGVNFPASSSATRWKNS